VGGESPAQHVELEGVNYRVEQITPATWTVARPAGPAQANAQQTALLVRVVEKASRCKVTDSSYVRDGAVMNAQVDCGSKLRN